MRLYYKRGNIKIYNGSCLDIEYTKAGNITAIVTDPPYELGFMGKDWDKAGVSFRKSTWEILRDRCLPGAPLLAFGGSRTQHRIACAIEDAGWEIRDTLMWVYGSGMPKSYNISKGIDKKLGAERKVVGVRTDGKATNSGSGVYQMNDGKDTSMKRIYEETAAGSDEAAMWEGYGTSLKPAYEPIILGMNTLDSTFVDNALKHGVAGLNIDECRIPLGDEKNPTGSAKRIYVRNQYDADAGYGDNKVTPDNGRFPANFLHDGSKEVIELFPDSKGQLARVSGNEKSSPIKNVYSDRERTEFNERNDAGSAARFFYCAKASKSERGDNSHPTVKPLALILYLCKMVKMPENNYILDPFCGSGTTLLACAGMGIDAVGIELNEEYCKISATRLDKFFDERK